jgi:hypothetical protein
MLCTDLLVTTRLVYKIFKRNSIVLLSRTIEPNISKCKHLILAKQRNVCGVFHCFICYEYILHLLDPYSSTAVRYGIHH